MSTNSIQRRSFQTRNRQKLACEFPEIQSILRKSEFALSSQSSKPELLLYLERSSVRVERFAVNVFDDIFDDSDENREYDTEDSNGQQPSPAPGDPIF